MLSEMHDLLGLAKASERALLVLCLFLFPGAACPVVAGPTATEHTADDSSQLNSYFAIADFDGDQKPDLATVEIQKGSSPKSTLYAIRFKLSAGATQVFGVTAPAGGLQIVARDVNGDNAMDVLVSTAWFDKQVAVFLNDGQGNFALAEPDAFPTASWPCETLWKTPTIALCESAALVRFESSAGEFKDQKKFPGIPSRCRNSGSHRSFVSTRPFRFPLVGRAPPTFLFES